MKKKKIWEIPILALLVFALSACSNTPKSNTIANVELTERERAILSTVSDQSFVFDFEIDSEFKEVSVWLEKYESGNLVEEQLGLITTQVEEKGSILFATSRADSEQKQRTFHIGISCNGGTGSTNWNETISMNVENMSSVWGSFPGESLSIEEEAVLAGICYSDNEYGMSSLSAGFYSNAEGNMDELAEYDVAYLLKAEWVK